MLRVFFAFGWIVFIFICTCTTYADIESMKFQFIFTNEPVFSSMLEPLPEEMSQEFVNRKIGHILAFFILTLAIYQVIPKNYFYAIFAYFYAWITEILQLFFMRDGRFFDVVFDSIGIVVALLILELVRKIEDIKIKKEL